MGELLTCSGCHQTTSWLSTEGYCTDSCKATSLAKEVRYFIVLKDDLSKFGSLDGSTREELDDLLDFPDDFDAMVVIRGVQVGLRIALMDD